ncbi:MAG: HEAT repeat domain-containing protein [Planctomycetota bacterium]
MRLLVLLLLLPALVLGEDEKPAEKPPEEKPGKRKTAAELDIPDPGSGIDDPAVARQEIARFDKEMRAAPSPAKEAELLLALGGWDHPDVLKAVTKYLRDKERDVAVAAAIAIARQSRSKEAAGKILLGTLRSEKRTDVVCAAIVGMGRLGFDNKGAVNEVMKFFQRDTKETHKAATRYLGYIKYKPAFRQLAEKLEEPVSKNPNDPTNPPASYWKERWEEWSSNVPYTRWALSQLVEGESFEQVQEAKQWAESEGKKHGIEW